MIIILTVAMPISIVAQAEPSTERSYIQTSTVFSEKSLDDMLDLYTEFRADTLRKNKKVLLTDPAEKRRFPATAPSEPVRKFLTKAFWPMSGAGNR